MQLKFTVQNPGMTQAATRAKVGERDMTVSVEAYECDLVSDDRRHGGLKLRFIGDEVEAAKEMFKNDAVVTATFAAEGAQEAPKP